MMKLLGILSVILIGALGCGSSADGPGAAYVQRMQDACRKKDADAIWNMYTKATRKDMSATLAIYRSQVLQGISKDDQLRKAGGPNWAKLPVETLMKKALLQQKSPWLDANLLEEKQEGEKLILKLEWPRKKKPKYQVLLREDGQWRLDHKATRQYRP